MHVLHRMDVDENKVKEAFKIQDQYAVAETLATLVIERQILEVKTRQQYQSDDDSGLSWEY